MMPARHIGTLHSSLLPFTTHRTQETQPALTSTSPRTAPQLRLALLPAAQSGGGSGSAAGRALWQLGAAATRLLPCSWLPVPAHRVALRVEGAVSSVLTM